MTAEPIAHPERRELRIALAMRGGVSLAVWIGGAVAEIDLLRRAFDPAPPPAPHPDPVASAATVEAEARRKHYRELLREAGYNAVKVDVLAGASAGGLNAVIYGVAQSAGLADLDWLGKVWADKGELWTLMHDHWRLEDTFGVPGLLRGDNYFYTSILDELREQLSSGASKERATDYLTVDLAATLADGPDLLRPQSFGGTTSIPRSREAAFHFRHTPAPPGRHNDFPESKDDDAQLRRLAYAARATSSFPGAFEPALIGSGEGAGRVADSPGDMSTVFSESGPGADAEFRVVDGGVFDNIPITRALAAVADSPASARADRFLVYLDPSPPLAGSTRTAAGPSAGSGGDFFSRTVLRAVLMKVRTEEASDELAQIRAYNAETRTQLRRQLEACNQVSRLDAPPVGWATAYTAARADLDCDRVLALAIRPGLGLLRSAAPPLVAGRAMTQDDALTRRTELREELAGRSPDQLAQDARALAWLTTLFVATVRDRERDEQVPARVRSLGHLKKRLYLIRAAAMLIADLDDRAEVTRLLGGEPTSGFDVEAAARLVTDSDERSFWAALADEGVNDPDCDALWHALAEVVADDALQGSLPVWDRGMVEVLKIYGAVLVTSIGVPTAGKAIKFASVTGDEQPAGDLDDLTAQALRDTVREALSGKVVSAESVALVASRPLLRAATKLSGSELANFSGFLDKRWRMADWQWGRADAYTSLTWMLRKEAGYPARGLEGAPDNPDATSLLTSVGPKQRFGDLSPVYRYALVAWLVQLLLRAIWPLRAGRTPTASNMVRAFALMAVRPVVIFLPLLARPVALAMLVVTVVTSQRFEPEPPVAFLPTQIPVGILVLWAGFLLGRAAGLSRRWRTAGEAWATPDLETVRDWAAVRVKHLLYLQLALVAVLLLGMAALVGLSSVGYESSSNLHPLESIAIAVGVIALGEVALGRLRHAPGAAGRSRDHLVWGLVLLALLNAGFVGLLATTDRWPYAATAMVALAAAVSAALVHHGWADDGTVIWTGLFVGTITYGALVLRQEWAPVRDLDPRVGALFALLSVPLVFGGIVAARWTPPRSWVVALILSTVLATAGVLGVLTLWPHQPLPHALLIAGAVSSATTLFVPRRERAPAA